MADLDVSKKLSVYHLLYRLNLSFANIVRRCSELEETQVVPSKDLRRLQGFAQELQAEINQELLLPLHEFIQAEQRRRELERHGQKPPRTHVQPASPRKRRLGKPK